MQRREHSTSGALYSGRYNQWRNAMIDFAIQQIIRTQPGHHLAIHYQSMTGEKFELEVYDGNTINATKLTHVNQWTGVNQAVTPSSSSGHELYIRFRYSAGSKEARVAFIITDDRGKKQKVLWLDFVEWGGLCCFAHSRILSSPWKPGKETAS